MYLCFFNPNTSVHKLIIDPAILSRTTTDFLSLFICLPVWAVSTPLRGHQKGHKVLPAHPSPVLSFQGSSRDRPPPPRQTFMGRGQTGVAVSSMHSLAPKGVLPSSARSVPIFFSFLWGKSRFWQSLQRNTSISRKGTSGRAFFGLGFKV